MTRAAAILAALLLAAPLLPLASLARAESAPNLVMENLTISPAHPRAGDPVTVSVTLRNVGGPAPYVSSSLSIPEPYTSFAYGSWTYGAGASAGSSFVLSFTRSSLPEGTYRIHAEADDEHAAAESDETDNVLEGDLVIYAGEKPDLVVSAINVIRPDPSGWADAQVEFRVANRGLVVAPPASLITELPGWTTYPSDTQPLQPGEERGAIVYYTNLPGGTLHFAAQIDPSNLVQEANETNNALAVTYGMPVGDLTVRITDVRTTQNLAIPSSRDVDVQVCNAGDWHVSQATLRVDAIAPGVAGTGAETREAGAFGDLWLSPGICITRTVAWSEDALGDVTFRATVSTPEPEARLDNNQDEQYDATLVAHAGGVMLPHGV
jgi:hypothetical protein